MNNLDTVRVIRNDLDREEAVRLIDTLWDNEVGSPEHDKFEALITLVVEYDRKRRPEPTPKVYRGRLRARLHRWCEKLYFLL